ncbi:hypothetical protein ACOME3_002727 [Neoechinorhynchus agilis]
MLIRQRLRRICTFLTVIGLFILYLLFRGPPLIPSEDIQIVRDHHATLEKLIYIYTPNKYTPKAGSKCQNCLFTHHRSDLDHADSIVVHLNDVIMMGANEIVKDRRMTKRDAFWVAMFEETPCTLIVIEDFTVWSRIYF